MYKLHFNVCNSSDLKGHEFLTSLIVYCLLSWSFKKIFCTEFIGPIWAKDGLNHL